MLNVFPVEWFIGGDGKSLAKSVSHNTKKDDEDDDVETPTKYLCFNELSKYAYYTQFTDTCS